MPALTVHNAEIRTAKVEVKTLTLAGKQVTLSVFRQLPERPLIAVDGTLHGVPWGTVNYHPDKSCDAEDHLHVVWQHGSELLRARVDLDPRLPKSVETKNGDAWLRARFRDSYLRSELVEFQREGVFVKEMHGVPVRLDVDRDLVYAAAIQATLFEYLDKLAADGPDSRCRYWGPKRGRPADLMVSTSAAVRATWQQLDEAVAALRAEPLAEVESRLLVELHDEGHRRTNQRDARKALADLPQLYIAV